MELNLKKKRKKAATWAGICKIHVHNSIIYNRQKMEAAQVPTDGWMEKQNVVYAYNRILCKYKKKGIWHMLKNG